MTTTALANTAADETTTTSVLRNRNSSESFANTMTCDFWTTTARPWRKRSKSSGHIQLLQNDTDGSDHGTSDLLYHQDFFKPSSCRSMPERRPLWQKTFRPPIRQLHHRGKRDPPPSISPSWQQQQQQQQQFCLIPAEHPYKVLWDFITVLISCYYAYATHTSIRDRKFGWQHSSFFIFSEIWFFIDILLNFATERKISSQVVLRDPKRVWARYLTTWFAVDVLSLLPWESWYVQPIIEQQNRRPIWKKTLFRSRAVLRFCRQLGGRHFKLFGQVARTSKVHAGVGALRLIRLLLKYVPKYLLFLRNMKMIIAVRVLRQVNWFRKVLRHNPTSLFWTQRRRQRGGGLVNKDDAETSSISTELMEDDDLDGTAWWDDLSEDERCTRMRTLVRVVGYDAKFVSRPPTVVNDFHHHHWSEDDDPY